MIFKNQHGLCNFVWFRSTTRWKVSPKVGLRFTSDHPSFRVGHGRQGTWYQWSNQWLWGGNTMGYGVARCPCVVPDKTDGVCADRIPRKKKKNIPRKKEKTIPAPFKTRENIKFFIFLTLSCSFWICPIITMPFIKYLKSVVEPHRPNDNPLLYYRHSMFLFIKCLYINTFSIFNHLYIITIKTKVLNKAA